MVLAEKKLSSELFSQDEQAELKGLLEKSARAKLSPPILKFIQQVEGALQNYGTVGKRGQPEPTKPAVTIREVVEDYLGTHKIQESDISKTAAQLAGEYNFPAQAVETVIHVIQRSRKPVKAPQPVTQQIQQEPQASRKGASTEKVIEFLYEHPDTNIQAVIEYTGATERAVKTSLTRLRTSGQLEFDRLRLTGKGRNTAENGRDRELGLKTVPVVQIIAAQPASIAPPEPAKPTGKIVVSPDKKPALGSVLSVYLSQHPNEELTTREVVNYINRRFPHFTKNYISTELSGLKGGRHSVEGGKVVGERGKLKFVPETSPQDAGNINATGKLAVARTITPSVRPNVRIDTPARHLTETPRDRMQRPALQPNVPREPQPTAEVYLRHIEDAIKGLGTREQNAVRSYVSRISGTGSGQTGNAQASPVQLLNLSVFTESFVRIQRFKDLPPELYDVLDGINVYEQNRITEFQDELRRAKDSFDVLSVVSERAMSPYAVRVNDLNDIRREDPQVGQLLRHREGFHTETVNARNSIPRLRVKQFYETIKKISIEDINWGSRYNDVLKLSNNNPRSAVRFFEWASGQENINGYRFDTELRKYMPLGSRAGLMAREDLGPRGGSNYSMRS